MSDTIELTAELRQQIVSSIRAGGYAHVAAQAWGVPHRLWRRWLSLGRRRGAPEPYASFCREVQQAEAQARLKAEIETLGADPRFWLKTGPGKDEAPGWSTGRAARSAADNGPTFNTRQIMKLMAGLRACLAAQPGTWQLVEGLTADMMSEIKRRR